MTTTPRLNPWPARMAYAAAGLFTLASSGTNVIYGWSKGTDIPSSFVWCAVSLAVSIVFALSWPALLRCCDSREWARAVFVAVALLLTGTYSVSAALGSAMGARVNAATEEKVSTDARSKAQTAYDYAHGELQKLKEVRPEAELRALIEGAQSEFDGMPATRSPAQLQALIEGTRLNPQAAGCAAINGSLRMQCPALAEWRAELTRATQRLKLSQMMSELRAELARAEKRTILKSELAEAAAKLERTGPPRQANSDAAALAVYLQGLGVPVDPDRLNKLLVLLAVLVVECGGGLALAVGMSLAVPVRAMGEPLPEPAAANVVRTDQLPNSSPAQSTPQSTGQQRLLAMLHERGGRLVMGQRTMAEALRVSKTQVVRLLGELSASGHIDVVAGRSGTAVQLQGDGSPLGPISGGQRAITH